MICILQPELDCFWTLNGEDMHLYKESLPILHSGMQTGEGGIIKLLLKCDVSPTLSTRSTSRGWLRCLPLQESPKALPLPVTQFRLGPLPLGLYSGGRGGRSGCGGRTLRLWCAPSCASLGIIASLSGRTSSWPAGKCTTPPLDGQHGQPTIVICSSTGCRLFRNL